MVSPPGLLPEVVLKAQRAAVADVAFSVAVEAPTFFRRACSTGVGVGTSGSQGSNEAGIPGDRGLFSACRVLGQVHQNEGGLLVSGS